MKLSRVKTIIELFFVALGWLILFFLWYKAFFVCSMISYSFKILLVILLMDIFTLFIINIVRKFK